MTTYVRNPTTGRLNKMTIDARERRIRHRVTRFSLFFRRHKGGYIVSMRHRYRAATQLIEIPPGEKAIGVLETLLYGLLTATQVATLERSMQAKRYTW